MRAMKVCPSALKSLSSFFGMLSFDVARDFARRNSLTLLYGQYEMFWESLVHRMTFYPFDHERVF